jgi:hypothetical protein
VASDVPGGEVRGREAKDDAPRLAGREGDSLEATELLQRPVDLRFGTAHVELYDLVSGA